MIIENHWRTMIKLFGDTSACRSLIKAIHRHNKGAPEFETFSNRITQQFGLGKATVGWLWYVGLRDADYIQQMNPRVLLQIPGVGRKKVQALKKGIGISDDKRRTDQELPVR